MRSILLVVLVTCWLATTIALDDINDYNLQVPPSIDANGQLPFGNAPGPLNSINPYETVTEEDFQYEPPSMHQQSASPSQHDQVLPQALPEVRFLQERAPGPFSSESSSSPAQSFSHSATPLSAGESSVQNGNRHIITTTTTTVTRQLKPIGSSSSDGESSSSSLSSSSSSESASAIDLKTEKLRLQLERERARAEVIQDQIAHIKEKEKHKEHQIQLVKQRLNKKSHSDDDDDDDHHHEHSHKHHHRHGEHSENSQQSESSEQSEHSHSESGESSQHHEQSADSTPKKCNKNKILVDVSVRAADDCEDESPETGEIKQLKRQLKILKTKYDGKLNVFNSENVWFTRALELINGLKTKAKFVKLHLHDVSKDIHKIGRQRHRLQAQLHSLQGDAEEEKRLKALQHAMEQLLDHADLIKTQMKKLATKKETYLTKVNDIRQSLETLKAKHEQKKREIQQQMTHVVAQPRTLDCPCSIPLHLRPAHCVCI